MKRLIVTHRRVIWESSTFPAEIPDGVDPHDYVRAHLDELEEKAREEGSLDFSTGDDRNNELQIQDEEGNEL